jgi:hypothetical protein
MAKTTYLAAKNLTIDGVAVPAGTELLSVETAHPVERALNAVAIGSAVTAEAYAATEPARKDADAPERAAAAAPAAAKKTQK